MFRPMSPPVGLNPIELSPNQRKTGYTTDRQSMGISKETGPNPPW
jgi:hypothetical protein